MKKVLSTLLAVLMIVSVMSTGVTAFADKGGGTFTMEDAQARYDSVSSFDHVDIRVAGSITVDGVKKNVTIANPTVEIYYANGDLYKSKSFTTSESYEWRMTRLSVPKDARVVLTCDVTIDGEVKNGMEFTFAGEEAFVKAIYDCDGHQGLDFIVDEEKVQEVFYYHVSYQWSGLPEGLVSLPTDGSNYLANDSVTVNTSFQAGDIVADPATGDKYVFSGWTAYQPESGELTALNGAASFLITADTVVFGSWTMQAEPTTVPGSLTINKSFAGLPENLRPASAEFTVTGPNGFSQTVTLNAGNNWSAVIGNLSEGEYTVTETAAALEGYVYTTAPGSSIQVTLTKGELDETNNSYTVSSGTAGFTNTYTRLGSLTIAKAFGADSELNADSADIGKFVFTVTGPEGFETRTVELPIASSATPWEFTLENLPEGTYTVTEDALSAQRTSYVLTINGAGDEDDTVSADVTNGSSPKLTITNTYAKKMGEDINRPASFKVVKTDEQGNVLPGAEFTLFDKDNNVITAITTDANGEAVFGGFTKAAEYTLKETKAPENYVASEQTWTVTVKLKDGDPTIQISEDGSFWNQIFNWIVSTDPSDVDGVLTVQNKLKTGSLTVTMAVENNKKLGPETEEYTITLNLDGKEQSFKLKDGESKTFENIPYGTAYTLTQKTGDGASWNVKAPADGKAQGTIAQESTTVDFVNRYEYADATQMAVFSAVKQSSADSKALSGAEFTVYSDKDCTKSVASASTDANGKVGFGFKTAGSFYLKETKAPSGYVLSNKVIELAVSVKEYKVENIENTLTIVPVLELKVTGAQLLSGSTSVFQLVNDPEKYIDITVNKLWKNDKEAGKRPDTITVILYKDGEKYDSKTISEKDKWSCTWKNLPSQYKWTVDEGSLPAGYTKSISLKGTTFTITNTYSSIPQTGDDSAPILWALLTLATASGAALTMKKLRKEKG